MVHVIAELRNYRQLTRLRTSTISALESAITAAFGSFPVAVARPGMWVAETGSEDMLSVGRAAEAACRVRDCLGSHREELFGFAVLLARLPEQPEPLRSSAAERLLEAAEEEEQLWLAPECAPLFVEALSFERAGALFRVTGPRRPAAAPPASGVEAPRAWVREALVGRALDILDERLADGESRDVLWVHGPSGAGKAALVAEVSRRLAGDPAAPALRTRTIFKRRSPLHPFLSSLLPSIIEATSAYLRGPERSVWEEVGGLLSWLQAPAEWEERQDRRPLPDHIFDDFCIGYRLYLLAWTRMAEERLHPALMLCEGIDAYHPTSRRIVAHLFNDLLARPGFLPVVTSCAGEAPAELSGFTVRPLSVHPLGKREVRSLAAAIYPGLAIPESLARRLRRRCAGLSTALVASLRSMAAKGAIRPSADGGRWEVAAEPAVPANPLSAAWSLIRCLPEEASRVLYALYLAAGLLDRPRFLSFLREAGFDPETAARSLASLAGSGLVSDDDDLIPGFPGLRRKLEELLGSEGAAIRDRFVLSMASLWDSGRYRHPVLLFTFCARNGRTDCALRILPWIIRRKLDENDPQGARAFCDPRQLEFATAPTAEQARELAAVAAVGRLRAALLVQDREAADAAQSEVKRWVAADPRIALRRDLYAERARYFLFTGNSLAALDELKRGLLQHQESGEGGSSQGERSYYLWLGATMLAEGRMGESVEYLNLSQRLCHEAGDEPGSLWTLAYLCCCLFLDGRFTQSFAVLDRGIELARTLYRREMELYLLFLRARILFQVGSYDDCSLCLQSCLCHATLYSVEEALPVLRAWLGRTFIHLGDLASGTRLLESLSQQTREVLLFQAEAALFSGGLENASLYVERAMAMPVETRFPPPEGIPWWSGSTCVEGRCFRLNRGDSVLQRTLEGMRAYLLGLRGFRGEGIRELRRLTRGEKAMEEDPGSYWMHYLYSQILPEAGSDEVDDKVTVLSKSLKSLQERASRIEAPAERSSFLWHNRWNRMIMEEARDRKLV